MSDDLESRLRTIVAKVLKADAAQIRPDFKMGDHPRWDSLGHMDLVAAIENDFGIRFPSHALPRITSLPVIRREVEAALGAARG